MRALAIILLLIPVLAHGQEDTIADWEVIAHTNEQGSYLNIKGTVKNGWQINASNFPAVGLAPLKIQADSSEYYHLFATVHDMAIVNYYNEFYDELIDIYMSEIQMKIPVIIKGAKPVTVNGTIEYVPIGQNKRHAPIKHSFSVNLN